jgi:outer membrane receptor protein involved in Fe transport
VTSIDASSARNDVRSGAMEELIVTAQKRSESVQSVPISMTAMSGAKLERIGATEMIDFARDVPGLAIASNGPGQNQVIIRGVSSQAGNAATVGYYLDETPVSSRGRSLDASLFDLQRVEVLRGPQGTLYGSSSMGGTIKYVTNQPDANAVAARVATTLSTTEGGGFNTQVNAMLNVPLAEGKAAARITSFYRHEDGFIDAYRTDPRNILAIRPDQGVREDVNTETTWGTRAVFKFDPTDRLTITPSVYYQQTHLGAPFNIDVPPASYQHPYQSRLIDEPVMDRFTLSNVTAKYDFGPVQLISSTSYFNRRFNVVEDASKVNFFFFGPSPQSSVYPSGIRTNYDTRALTQEVRLQSTWSGPFQAIVGAYFNSSRSPIDQRIEQPAGYAATFGNPFGPADFFRGVVTSSQREKAAFTELSYEILDGLKFTAGLRVFEVRQSFHQIGDGVYNGGRSDDLGTASERGANPKFLLSYQVTPDILTYVTAAKGFRPGGAVPTVPSNVCGGALAALGLTSPPTSYRSDSLWSYEAGAKTSWANKRVTVNGSVYDIEWDDVQQGVLLNCGFGITANFGKATSKGGELEVSVLPLDGLMLTFGAGYTNATLSNSVRGATGKAGDRLQDVPRWSLSASAEYTQPLTSDLNGFARVDTNYTSRVNASFDRSSPYYQRGGYALTKVRVGVEAGGGWDASLFIDNLFNRRAQTGLPIATSVDLQTTRPLAINRPRTIGVNANYKF